MDRIVRWGKFRRDTLSLALACYPSRKRSVGATRSLTTSEQYTPTELVYNLLALSRNSTPLRSYM